MAGFARFPHTGVHRQFFGNQGERLCFSSGLGGLVFDTNGKQYFDFVLGYGAVSIGHANQDFHRLIVTGLSKGLLLPGYSEIHERLCVQLLRDHDDLQPICFFKSGSEAVSAALRLCATQTCRRGIVRTGYIGWHDALIAQTPPWHEPIGSPRSGQLSFPANMRGVGAEEPALNWIGFDVEELERLLYAGRDRIGAFVFDVYQLGRTTMDVLIDAVKVCRKYDVAVVFDETKTAGRLSMLGALSGASLRPDFLVIGKAIANGAPLSILLAAKCCVSTPHLSNLRIGGTYCAEAFGPAAGLATLDIMGSANGYSALQQIGNTFCRHFDEAARASAVADSVWARPTFGGTIIDIGYSQRLACNLPARTSLQSAFHNNGILLLDGHPNYVCLNHAHLDWTDLATHFCKAFSEWKSSIRAARNEGSVIEAL